MEAGAHSQQSLGSRIFGGLVVATVLSLGVVPPVYVLVKTLEQRLLPRQDASAQQAKAWARATTSGAGTSDPLAGA